MNISEIHPTLGFTEFDILEKYRKSFNESELGKLHSVFPFECMAKAAGLSDRRLGRRNRFSPSAKIALMVLKAYTGFSDRQLVEHLNGNIHYQIFCGIMIPPSLPITNFKIVSAIRNEIASRLDIDSFQELLASHWKPYLDNLHVCMTDATCYESHMRFPTDMKLLWESLEWLYRHICRHCRELGIRRPRNKYRNVAESYLSYCKKRKRRASRTRMLKRRMIKLLEKLLSQRDGIHSEYGALLRYTQDYHKRLSIIRKVLVQEKEMFEGRKVSDRIVSIDRHYVRPIVRGKETKSVEFGAWSQSVDDTHSRLVDVDWNATYPIYDLVSDPVKKADLKLAVEKYINSKKISVIKLVTLYQFHLCAVVVSATDSQDKAHFSSIYYPYTGNIRFASGTPMAA